MFLGIYAISIIIYFLIIRYLMIEDAFYEIDALLVFLIIILGLIPIVNAISAIAVYIVYKIEIAKITAEDILKKILFIKEENKGEFEDESY